MNLNALGSSPRLRGTQKCCFALPVAYRIIPASAGNTGLLQSHYPPNTDHPRVCGEHLTHLVFRLFISGSSPRLRGTLGKGHLHFHKAGIIPASAGNTCLCCQSWIRLSDHPRVCGEHFLFFVIHFNKIGSSPRLRGTPCGSVLTGISLRIIPASAGNTRVREIAKDPVTDHPRVCGEHVFILPLMTTPLGSSPRLRGTHETANIARHTTRIIPASAGNTPAYYSYEAIYTDHPRVCGEHDAR